MFHRLKYVHQKRSSNFLKLLRLCRPTVLDWLWCFIKLRPLRFKSVEWFVRRLRRVHFSLQLPSTNCTLNMVHVYYILSIKHVVFAVLTLYVYVWGHSICIILLHILQGVKRAYVLFVCIVATPSGMALLAMTCPLFFSFQFQHTKHTATHYCLY